MTSDSPADIPGVPIGVVERETGLTRDTLRKWESRYAIALPERNARGERLYSLQQVNHLRLMKRLLDRGVRPSKLAGLDSQALATLGNSLEATTPAPQNADSFTAKVLAALTEHDQDTVRRTLGQELMHVGLSEFVQAKMPSLLLIAGDAWASGQLPVYQEHSLSEILQSFVRDAIGRLSANPEGPRILLATPPDELHTLGLLMAQAQLVLDGANCIALGAQVPISELAAAADAYQVKAIALSFSVAYPVRRIRPQLSELRRRLAPEVALWVGGKGLARVRNLPAGIRIFTNLAEAGPALNELQS